MPGFSKTINLTAETEQCHSFKSSFRQLKGSQASQFSLSTISLYKYKIKNQAKHCSNPPSSYLLTALFNGFQLFPYKKDTKIKQSKNPWRGKPSLLLRLLVKNYE
jgi:hypothetical protein